MLKSSSLVPPTGKYVSTEMRTSIGHCWPEIFPATLDHVRRTRQRFGGALDIVGTGGVDAPDKALALLDAGATAVGYFTGFITRGPLLARRICEHLLARRGG